MEMEAFLKKYLVIPHRLTKEAVAFKQTSVPLLLRLVDHVEKQFLDFDFRKSKMKLVLSVLESIASLDVTPALVREKGAFYVTIYLEWLRHRFVARVCENGFDDFSTFLDVVGIELEGEHLKLLMEVFTPISCKKEATTVDTMQLNPIRPPLPGILGNLFGMCIRYKEYSIYGLVASDPLRYFRNKLPIVKENAELTLLPTLSLRDLIVWEFSRLQVILRRDKEKQIHYKTQSIDSMLTEFKFLPLPMRHRMLVLLLENKQIDVAHTLLAQTPSFESEALVINLDWEYRVALGRPALVKVPTAAQQTQVPYEMKISSMSAPDSIKAKAFDMLKVIRKSNDGAPKAQKFLDALLKIPFGHIRQEPDLRDHKAATLEKIKARFPDIDTHNKSIHVVLDELSKEDATNYRQELKSAKEKQQVYLNVVQETLENAVHGHKEAKVQVRRLLAQWICGGQSGMVIGLQGPPGNGKTTLIKQGLAKCLVDQKGVPRPVGFIPLGGSTSGTSLEGHSYTYQGSKWGRIAEVLMTSNCMNPILLFDELDKVSKTERGREIIGILTHLTDSTQNQEFSDRYFDGIPLDLSRAVMVFTFNDISAIDPILLDRLTVIKTKPLSLPDKLVVSRKHLLVDIARSIGVEARDITISNDIVKYVIQTYTAEAGARQLKQLLQDLIRELNLRRLTDPSVKMEVTQGLVDSVFQHKDKTRTHKIPEEDLVGQINGMYANALGMGGVLPIQVSRTRSDTALAMELTGMQGDVMKESMKCAKTMAWSLLEEEIRKDIDTTDKFGLHIHCPNAATPKDGPSAGGAICLAIMSALANKPIRRDVAMTGELDLRGKITAIGGLGPKLTGAKEAGVKLALIPKQNHAQLVRLREQRLSPEDNGFEVREVDTIDEAIEVIFNI
jgi:hypothetical protein